MDTGKVNETLEQMVRTVLNRNETLVMIDELKAPFERERIIREYLMTGKREYFDKVLSCKDQYLELLDKLSRDIVKRNPELKPRATDRINRLLVHPLHQPEKTMMLPFGQSKVLDEDSSMANLTEPKSFELRGGTVWGETILLSHVLGTDSEVLDHMMKSVLKKYDSHDNILRVIQTIKLKMLLDKDKKLLQSLRRVFGFETNGPLPLDALMKEHLELISGNYPMKTDADRQIRVAGSANRLNKIFDFVENRNEMMKVHSQLQNVGWRKSKHEDISKEIKDGKALMSTLQKEIGDLLRTYISEDNVTLISRFIDAGIDLETRDSNGVTMLIHAVVRGKDQLVEMLIKAGCDVEARDRAGDSVLSKAAFRGFSNMESNLIYAGAALEDEGIDAAIQMGHVDVMRTFIKHGKHLIVQNGEEFLLAAITNGQYDMVKLIIDLGVEVEEDTLRGMLVATVTGGEGNGGAMAVLQTDMMSPSLNMNLEYIRQVAKHGDLDLYRQLVLLRKPRYPDIIELPHKTDLPYFPVVDCNVHRTITDEQINSTFHLNEWFPALTEITILPGYGLVNGLLSLQELNNDPKLHTFHEISEYCDKIVKESINNAEIEEEGIRFSYRKCGSSAEGTKVAFPDEFDYFLRCHVDIDASYKDIKDEGHGYVLIKSAGGDRQDFLKSLIILGSKSFHDTILAAIISAELHQDKIMTKSTGFTRGGGTASSEWNVRYKFDDDHSLDISVDLVPVLHIDGWPNDARDNTWLMNKKELQEEGYAFVAKPPSRKSKFGKQFRDEVQSKMWRISFGHLEARHLAELDQRTKDVYITCKAIRNPDISHMMFEDSNGKPLPMSKDLITSYFLKTVFMFNVPEFLLEKRTLVEMVYIVYSQVAKCISRWWLPYFWQPHINILEGLSQDPKQCKQAAKLMKRLATGWFMRDGHTDCVEEEETKKGGIYPYLPPKPSRVRRAGGNKGGEGSADVRKTKKDDEAKAGCPECSDGDGDEVVSPDVGGRVGKPVVGEKVCDAENGGRVGGPEDGERVRGPEVGDRVGGPRRDDKVSGPDAGGALNGHEDNSQGGCSEDEDDDESEDEFEVITYSRTPNTIRDPGYKLYRL